MDRENGVRARRCLIQQVVCSRAVGLSLEEAVQRFLLVFALDHRESFHVDFALGVVENRNRRAGLLVGWHRRKHVEEQFVINFEVGHFHGDLGVETAAHFLENVVDGSWNDSTVLVVLGAASHRERLAGASLAVAQDCGVVTVNYAVNCLVACVLEHRFLRGVVKQLVEFKLPVFCLVVDMTAVGVFRDLNLNCLKVFEAEKSLRRVFDPS